MQTPSTASTRGRNQKKKRGRATVSPNVSSPTSSPPETVSNQKQKRGRTTVSSNVSSSPTSSPPPETVSNQSQKNVSANVSSPTSSPPENVSQSGPYATHESAPVSFPGGPFELDVLPNFGEHVALKIYEGVEREDFRVHSHGQTLAKWLIPNHAYQFKQLVDKSGISQLGRCSLLQCDKNLIEVLVERWQPDTNTFHLPFGEMTITLDDIYALLKLSVDGKAVQSTQLMKESTSSFISTVLGVSEDSAMNALEGGTGHNIKLDWLRNTFMNLADSSELVQVEYAVRAYLLYTLGCTIFIDKTGNRVNAHLLEFLIDLADVHNYAWGAAALAQLYNQLGEAAKAKRKQIAGFLTLLEVWAYEHFPCVRPLRCLSVPHYTEDLSRVFRWTSRSLSGNGNDQKIATRIIFDQMEANDVVWEPYKDARQFHPLPEISFFTGCIPVLGICEPYCPERVLRQFGRVQTIPPPPLLPSSRRKSTNKGKHKVNTLITQTWSRWRSHLLDDNLKSRPISLDESDCVPGYLDWYIPRTHRYIQPQYNPLHATLPMPTSTDERVVACIQRVANIGRSTIDFIQANKGGDIDVASCIEAFDHIQSQIEEMVGTLDQT